MNEKEQQLTQEIMQLKAEVYDLSKQAQNTSKLLGTVAELLKVNTQEEMLNKINNLLAMEANSVEVISE